VTGGAEVVVVVTGGAEVVVVVTGGAEVVVVVVGSSSPQAVSNIASAMTVLTSNHRTLFLIDTLLL
jgi:hypothetical protein